MTLRQREPREECPAFLAFIRTKPCCACGRGAPSQAAHIRMACQEIGKRSTGMAEKPHDRWAVPLCAGCHLDDPDAQHKVGEKQFWHRVGLDPFEIAAALWGRFEDEVDAKIAKQRLVEIAENPQSLVRGKKLRARLSRIAPKFRNRSQLTRFPKTRTRVNRIPNRPLQSANRWAPKGSQKFNRRKP